MMVALLVVGGALVVAGLAAVGFGVPYKEFSVGGTLIETGVVGVCSGVIVLAVAAVVRQLQIIAQRLGPLAAGARAELPAATLATSPHSPASGDTAFAPQREPPAMAPPMAPPPLAQPPAPPTAPGAPPWHEEIAQRGTQGAAPPPAASPDAAPKRRNLLFASSSRKERERADSRAAEPLPPDLLSPELRPNPPAVPPEPAPATFDDAWPRAERARSVDVAPRRAARMPSTFGDAQAAAPSPGHPPAPQEQPAVTVLKSGVVDGMAYSLYSDGSIEAQMPEGMMRFASIDELRSHLEQRP
ncbi:DUF308 domain-containing protein [Bradyrhizobium genosp. L]|uniref:DUF308 domain-containing protein n=1 Tax=Bradyrhizobium genosp. L TaxID=83637 RepID=UPI0018A25437|nr:DUF308 domain-containing protein [Bradyrhizobium genosp. L]QPF86971.1 DUF308 domain-containing protein [Bradyrhizobium genosp. L]